MKACPKCNTVLPNEAKICSNCNFVFEDTVGHLIALNHTDDNESNTSYGILAIVFSFFLPLLGLIFGAIGLGKLKQRKARRLCAIGITIALFMLLIQLVISFLNLWKLINIF